MNNTAEKTTALEEARKKFVQKYPLSYQLYKRACSYMPGGNTRTPLYYPPFPITIARAENATVWDVDGNRYINFHGEYSAGLLGHSNPLVISAIEDALKAGLCRSGPSIVDIEFAKLLCERFPSIELVRFTNSGTEASILAITAALQFTSKNKIVVFDGAYHGSGLAFVRGKAIWTLPYDFEIAQYNDADDIRKVFDNHGADIAAVIIEPMQSAGGCIAAKADFLQLIRKLTKQYDALLIFDEVVTSRLGDGGGLQSVLGITPDITTLGKYIGGGIPIGAVGGRREIMGQFNPEAENTIYHAGTFNNNALSIAAGIAVMAEVYTPSEACRLNGLGDELRIELNKLLKETGAKLQFTGCGSVMTAHFIQGNVSKHADLALADDKLKELLFLYLLEKGIYITRRGMVALSLPIKGHDCESFISAIKDFVTTYASIVKA